MRRTLCKVQLLSALFTLLLMMADVAVAQQEGPLNLDLVRQAIDTLPDPRVRVLINSHKVDFDLTPEIENDLRTRGASPETLDLIRVKRYIAATSVVETAPRPEPPPAPVDLPVPAPVATPPAPVPAPVPAPAPAPAPPTPVAETPAAPPSVIALPVTPPAAPSVPASPSNGLTPQQVLNRILEACGGAATLKAFNRFAANANLMLVTGRGPQTEAQLKESVMYPNRIKWELRLAGVNWTVTSGPEETWSEGDLRFKGSDLGQELERNIKVFVAMHLAPLLTRLQERDVKLSFAPEADDPFALVAQTNDDRYTIVTDASNRPVRIGYEALTGLQPKFEMRYARYDTANKPTLPTSMTLRYPSQPGYGQEIRYARVDPAAQPKEGDFRRKGFLGVLPPK